MMILSITNDMKMIRRNKMKTKSEEFFFLFFIYSAAVNQIFTVFETKTTEAEKDGILLIIIRKQKIIKFIKKINFPQL